MLRRPFLHRDGHNSDVYRSNLLLDVHYPLLTSFRWVRLKSASGDSWAIVARSWTEHTATGSNPNTAVLQSYSLDVWLSISPAETWRYQAVFSENKLAVEVPDLSEESVAAGAADGVFSAGDAAIKKLFH